jgi:DnaJ like chaperone protein
MNYRNYFTQHARWGKIIGAILGFMMAGPIGAFIGVFVGNFFDRGLAQHFTKPHWSFRTEKRQETRDAFIRATFAVMGHLAKANGRVSEQAIYFTQTVMNELGLNKQQQLMAKRFFNEGKQSTFQLFDVLNTLKTNAYSNNELIRLFIELQYKTAQIDGLSNQKIIILNRIFQQMGLAPLHTQSRFYQDFSSAYTNQRSQYEYHTRDQTSSYANTSNTLTNAYSVLGLQSTATKEDVKRTYRRLVSRHHPDKIIAKGGSEKDIKAANEKTQAIRKAYEQICTYHRW